MKQFGSYLADTLAKDNQIPEEQQAVYAYLFDYLIESLLYDVIVLIIGMIFHHTGATVCYLLVTIPLRHFAGGFHANTRLGCTILSYGIFFLTVFPSSFLVSLIRPAWLWIILYILSWTFILSVAPVDTKNKRLSAEQKKKLFHRCITTCIIISVLVLILWITHWTLYYGMITICMLESVISVYIGIWKNRRNL